LLLWGRSLYVTRYATSNAFPHEMRCCALPPLRWNVFDWSCELCMRDGIDGPVPDPCARGVFVEKVVVLPVPRRPDWPGHEPAAAVWADVAEDVLHARCTERAFVRANARFP
jgi:hypothetical protein